VPEKVTEWIHHDKCLAFIATPKKTELDAGRVIDETSEVKVKDEAWVVTWWYNDGHTTRGFECSVDVEPRGPGGVLLMEREVRLAEAAGEGRAHLLGGDEDVAIGGPDEDPRVPETMEAGCSRAFSSDGLVEAQLA
jgi:hypothetical protein